MSKTRNRLNKTKPCCDRCKHPGFWRVRGFDRPLFVCDKCRSSWTCGKRGSPYFGHEMNLKQKLPNWVMEYDWIHEEIEQQKLDRGKPKIKGHAPNSMGAIMAEFGIEVK